MLWAQRKKEKRQQITGVDKDVEQRESLTTLGGIMNWYHHNGKQCEDSSKKLKIELPYKPAIPLLDIYLKKTKTLIRGDTCTPVFIAALFTIS